MSETRISYKRMTAMPVCTECRRWFDITDEEQANEWYYGHDCEAI
jgi:hypothetical protein